MGPPLQSMSNDFATYASSKMMEISSDHEYLICLMEISSDHKSNLCFLSFFLSLICLMDFKKISMLSWNIYKTE